MDMVVRPVCENVRNERGVRRLLRHVTRKIADIAEHHALQHSGPRRLCVGLAQHCRGRGMGGISSIGR